MGRTRSSALRRMRLTPEIRYGFDKALTELNLERLDDASRRRMTASRSVLPARRVAHAMHPAQATY
jgi:hypothetical protein